MDQPPARLSLEGISVTFGGIRALDGVDLTVGAGQVLGVIGPNGAGKTTLFDVISGVRQPRRGSIRIDGTDVTGWAAQRRARLGLRRTFQQLQTFDWLSVRDNVLAALEWSGGGGGVFGDAIASPLRRARERQRRQKVDEVLHNCGLADIADEPAASLPIGSARLVELARALVADPFVLLLDEPSSGLGHHEADILGARVEALRAERRCAVLLVEHDVGFVMRHSDEVVVMQSGQVLARGTPEDIGKSEVVRAAYLGDRPTTPTTVANEAAER